MLKKGFQSDHSCPCCRLSFTLLEPILHPESHHLQYKDLYLEVLSPQSLFQLKKTICAFANSLGGVLLIGVKEEADMAHFIKGIPELSQKKLGQILQLICKDFDPALRVDQDVKGSQVQVRDERQTRLKVIKIMVKQGYPTLRCFYFGQSKEQAVRQRFIFKREDNESRLMIDIEEIYSQVLRREEPLFGQRHKCLKRWF